MNRTSIRSTSKAAALPWPATMLEAHPRSSSPRRRYYDGANRSRCKVPASPLSGARKRGGST
eukprot:2927700-Prorocentrum_lima.AAC.1